jgi:hypothetical protein
VLRQEIVRHVIHFFAGLRRGYPAPRRFDARALALIRCSADQRHDDSSQNDAHDCQTQSVKADGDSASPKRDRVTTPHFVRNVVPFQIARGERNGTFIIYSGVFESSRPRIC